MFQIEFDNDTVVGIDLGTTNSLIAWMNLTKPEIIPGIDGDKMVPSIVSITAAGDPIVRQRRTRRTDQSSRALRGTP